MTSSFKTKSLVLVGDSGPTTDGSSKTQTYARCPKMYQFQYVRKIQVPRAQNPGYFSKGSIFGAARAAWFAIGFATTKKAWVHIQHAAQKEAELSRLPMASTDVEEALALFSAYMEYWIRRPLPRPIATEFKLKPHARLDRTGSLDDLSYYHEAGGVLCAGECKTTSGDISSCIREYEFHIQTLQYEALYHLDEEAQKRYGPIAGHLLDICKKPEKKGQKPAFHREFIKFTPAAIETFIRSSQALVKQSHTIEWDSSPVRTYQCTYQAGRARVDCTYKDLCRLGSSGAGKYITADGKGLRQHKPKPGQEKMPWE